MGHEMCGNEYSIQYISNDVCLALSVLHNNDSHKNMRTEQRATYNEYEADRTCQTPDEKIASAHPAAMTRLTQSKNFLQKKTITCYTTDKRDLNLQISKIMLLNENIYTITSRQFVNMSSKQTKANVFQNRSCDCNQL